VEPGPPERPRVHEGSRGQLRPHAIHCELGHRRDAPPLVTLIGDRCDRAPDVDPTLICGGFVGVV